MTRHVVGTIAFGARASASSVTCSCGWEDAAPSPEALQWRWSEHRRDVGARHVVPSDVRPNPGRGRSFSLTERG
jgi:hypothetical protein